MEATRSHRGSAITLEAVAGLALACAYSSSDEYVADIIRERRRAGAYGGQRRHFHVTLGLLVGATALLAYMAV